MQLHDPARASIPHLHVASASVALVLCACHASSSTELDASVDRADVQDVAHTEASVPAHSDRDAGAHDAGASRPEPSAEPWSVVQVAAGGGGLFGRLCVRNDAHEVACWGVRNVVEQNGEQIVDSDFSPVRVGPGLRFRAVSTSAMRTCAIEEAGVRCWAGVPGGGPWLAGESAAQAGALVPGSSGATSISVGATDACVTRDGKVACVARDVAPSDGDAPPPPPSPALVELAGLTSASQVSAGSTHVCAIASGALFCWGSNLEGQLGVDVGLAAQQPEPTQVAPERSWSVVAAGGGHTCAISDGELFCWGRNTSGQLGVDALARATTPVRVGDASDWTEVAAGGAHTCGIRHGGELYCWGANDDGQLGVGDVIDRDVPTRVGGLAYGGVALGGNFSCALQQGALSCWGSNTLGLLASHTDERLPVPIPVDVRVP